MIYKWKQPHPRKDSATKPEKQHRTLKRSTVTRMHMGRNKESYRKLQGKNFIIVPAKQIANVLLAV